jgi:2-oxoglutarate ferredoxin oxidoreductase subunit alpha
MEDADIALIAYGSEVRPCFDAMALARDRGIKVGVMKLEGVWPVPEEAIRDVAKNVRAVISVEMNIGKYAKVIERICGGLCKTARATINRGRIHLPQELLNVIEKVWS